MLNINRMIIDTTGTRSDLCDIGARFGTDKSPYNTTAAHRHPYTAVYDLLFSGVRQSKICLGEVGILDNASMKMWRSYFPNATLIGLEFDQNRIDNARRDGLLNTSYFYSDVSSIASLRSSFISTGTTFDILIDDSTHLFDHQINFVEAALEFVNPGGLLIIEDIFNGWDEDLYADKLKSFSDWIESATFLIPDHVLKFSDGMPEPYYNNDKILVLRRNSKSVEPKTLVKQAMPVSIKSSLSIFIVTHKPIVVPDDKGYIVIQAGSAFGSISGLLQDNTADNISDKNPFFSELTAHYWIWKNVQSEYVALMHYRRFFSPRNVGFKYLGFDVACTSDLVSELEKIDIIISEPFVFFHPGTSIPETVEQHYVRYHGFEFLIARKLLVSKHPDYVSTFDAVMRNNKLFANNLMAMKKSTFDAYCEWAFPLFFEIELAIDLKKYDEYQKRVIAFLSERLFTVWVLYNKKNLSVTHRNMVYYENA